jgi:hypothetical protein
MPTKIIRPDHFTKIRYKVPRSGKAEILVEASGPVSIYAISTSDIDKFRNYKAFDGLSFKDRTRFERDVKLPFDYGEEWYLILESESEKPVAVHYEVYY